MQAQQPDSQSIARRALDIDDYLDIIRRHRSWILGPAFAGLVAGTVIAYLLPDTYSSTGMIRVVPPTVPQRLVQSNVTEELTQRVNAMYQSITARTSLINLIQTFNLYRDDLKRLAMEDVVEKMKMDISMSALQGIPRLATMGARGGGQAFTITFRYHDRNLAQRVCNELVSMFIEETIRIRSTQSVATTEFFKEQLDTVKKDLEQIDRKITEFRLRNQGEVPEHEQANLARLSQMEVSVQNLNSALTRANQEKLQLEGQLRVYRDQLNAPQQATEQVVAAARNERLIEADREVAKLEASLAALKQSYRENHPDVQRVQDLLNLKLKQREQVVLEAELNKEAPRARPAAGMPARESKELQASITKTQAAIQAKDAETEEYQKQMSAARERIKALQARIDSSPVAQQEYYALAREREILQARHNELTVKTEQSDMATQLENRKQGESMEVLEQPYRPTEPSWPKRYLFVVGGLAIGLGLGALLAGVREVRNTALKNLKDVRAYTKLNVLGTVPLLENDFVVRRRRRLAILAWAGAFLIGVLLMSGSVFYYYTTRT